VAENLTQPTDADVEAFVDRAEPVGRREAAHVLLELMGRVTGVGPVLWGPSMIGYGSFHYRYDSGREGDSLVVGFSPRRASMSLYGLQHEDAAPLLARLGKHRLGAGCVYVGRLATVDLEVLEELVRQAWQRRSTA
jgi:hypothetical protein